MRYKYREREKERNLKESLFYLTPKGKPMQETFKVDEGRGGSREELRRQGVRDRNCQTYKPKLSWYHCKQKLGKHQRWGEGGREREGEIRERER